MSADLAEDALRDRAVTAGGKSFEFRIRRVPKGVIYTISPWNYPFFTAINSTRPALLAGNTVALKHENTPSVGKLFQRIFDSMGGMIGLCQHLSIDIPTSDRVIRDSSIDHTVFTGSVAGGASITRLTAERAANPTLREGILQVSLELGGLDAAYVAADADPVAVARMLVTVGRLHNSGQSCCATKRLFFASHHCRSLDHRSQNADGPGRCRSPTRPADHHGAALRRARSHRPPHGTGIACGRLGRPYRDRR
jgi:acyl-CoA reductase-like NAD-dependent aldehyde dehydrogenase